MAIYDTLQGGLCQRFCLWGVFRVCIVVWLSCQDVWFSASYMRICGFSALKGVGIWCLPRLCGEAESYKKSLTFWVG